MITVFNKIDILNCTAENEELPIVPAAPWLNGETSVYISAKEKINIDILRQELYTRVKEIHVTRYPYTDFLYEL